MNFSDMGYLEYQQLVAVFGIAAVILFVMCVITYLCLDIKVVWKNICWIKKRKMKGWRLTEKLIVAYCEKDLL